MRKDVTLLFLHREGELLLAMKKRGYGVGRWNGVGGKLEPGETPLQAAIRECQEEIGVTPKHPHKVAELDFREVTNPTFNHYAHVYIAEDWENEPHETEEMRPSWFKTTDIPYDDMWPDDRLWLPEVLVGKRFRARITLEDEKLIVDARKTYLEEGENFV